MHRMEVAYRKNVGSGSGSCKRWARWLTFASSGRGVPPSASPFSL